MITQDELKRFATYDPETGFFIRLARGKGTHPGLRLGTSRRGAGYLGLNYKRKVYGVHKLAWLYVHGTWPEMLDHINGDKHDNRICNLRQATKSQNSANSKRSASNTSGYKGVDWQEKHGKWRARITKNYKIITLGLFRDPVKAHQAYVAAAKELFGEFACDGERPVQQKVAA